MLQYLSNKYQNCDIVWVTISTKYEHNGFFSLKVISSVDLMTKWVEASNRTSRTVW